MNRIKYIHKILLTLVMILLMEMNTSSFFMLALFGIHLGLHWNWILRRLNLKKITND